MFNEIGLSVYIDVAYLGLAMQKEIIDISKYDCVQGIIWSLSKPFGVYYHRIGGILTKNNNPLLYGNMWFKNIYSMNFGIQLMKSIPIEKNWKLFKSKQEEVCGILSHAMDINVIPSDVFLLSLVVKNTNVYPCQKDFIRNERSSLIRICISPLLDKKINDK